MVQQQQISPTITWTPQISYLITAPEKTSCLPQVETWRSEINKKGILKVTDEE